jgi:hypothetical protein
MSAGAAVGRHWFTCLMTEWARAGRARQGRTLDALMPGSATRGTAATEFALNFPVVMLLCGGIVEVGRLFAVYNETSQIGASVALSWADCSDASPGYCQAELSTYSSSATLANVAP